MVERAGKIPGFYGAFFHGSVNWLPDDAELSPTSDLDVMVVLNGSGSSTNPGKFLYQNVLLEVSLLGRDRLQSPEQVLGDYRLAGSFKGESVILDPSGTLTKIQKFVVRNYSKNSWVHKRCESAKENVLGHLSRLSELDPFHDQVSFWLFANGVLTHILLAAGLKNPTVRRRYAAARELLEEYGRLDFYETLLEVLGCAQMSREQVERHLDAAAEAFDAAKAVVKPSYQFAADLTDIARPIAIDGSRELIEEGYHREAVFWIVATYSRCQWVLAHDAPLEMQERFSAGYRNLLRDLGVDSFAAVQQRSEQVEEFLPNVMEVAEVIMAANAEIESD